MAQQTWLLNNNVANVSSIDEIYKYDSDQQLNMLAARPWDKE